jgi:hypothetical protein
MCRYLPGLPRSPLSRLAVTRSGRPTAEEVRPIRDEIEGQVRWLLIELGIEPVG